MEINVCLSSLVLSIKHFWYKQLNDSEFTILTMQAHLASCTISLINSQYTLQTT
jgi:hypothetical protein